MSNKKRITVTTIETHELWIIRKAVPEPADEGETMGPLVTAEGTQPFRLGVKSQTQKQMKVSLNKTETSRRLPTVNG